MKLASVKIDNYRAIKTLDLPLHPQSTVLHGENGCGKTSILTAIALAFAPTAWGNDRPVKMDKHMGFVGVGTDPAITLTSDNGCVLSAVEGNDLVNKWGHTNEDGSFICDVPNVHPDAPLFLYYDIDRSVVSSLKGREVGTDPDYGRLFDWFYATEYEELRLQRDEDPTTRIGSLCAVRDAICHMLDGVSNPRIGWSNPPRLIVSVADDGTVTDLAFEQLSDGYRAVLAIAADIARHMAELDPVGSPPNRLHSEAVVLIDEIELHLHPAWQQRVLTDLTHTFPNAQFIVSTHSPQVLTTVHPQHIVELALAEGRIVTGAAGAPTFGAEAGDVLSGVMGVSRRPANEFSELLTRYLRLISYDKGETEDALELRRKLDELSSHDPALRGADLEIRRRKVLREMGKS